MSLTIKTDISKQILKQLGDMQSKELLVGIPSKTDQRQDSDEGNAQIAYQNQFGRPALNIPARPFLDVGIKNAQPQILKALEKGAKNLDVDIALNSAGLLAQSAVRNVIRTSEGFKPLSSKTISVRKEKGFDGTRPLIETGSLLNSITYVVAPNAPR
jgi:hypothetical protein